MVRILLVVLAFATLYGCAQASTPVEKQENQAGVEKTQENRVGVEGTQGQTRQEQAANLPAYDVVSIEGCTEGGIQGKCLFVVSSDATSSKDFRALTEHLREENPGAEAVFITFLPDEGATRMSGFGYWFATKDAAKAWLKPELTNSEIRGIMDNGGFLVGRVVPKSAGETTGSTPS